MRRIGSKPRAGWQQRVEEAGLLWHSGETPYWNESAFYEFTTQEIELLESATNELAEMALTAAQHIIDTKAYKRLGISQSAVALIENSWTVEPPSIYGRFDLAYDGIHPPKLLEYNADTPTSLIEAAVAQWYWLQDVFPAADQFNSIHERLIARWEELAPDLPGGQIDFCSMDDLEDGMTVTYLMDTARQAGLVSSIFPIDEIAWNGEHFLGPDAQPLSAVFKLYPWEWMVEEEFGERLSSAGTIWMEPPWKMLLSNKGILPILWELYPGHPYLLEAHLGSPDKMASWVRKPLLGREGANITLHDTGAEIKTEGEYGDGDFVYQALSPLKQFQGKFPVIGSWVIGHHQGAVAGGIGIRESESPIITNTSYFVPHVF